MHPLTYTLLFLIQSGRSTLVMRERACDIAGTRRNKANSVSKSNVHTRKFQLVNLQYRRLWWEEGGTYVRIRISTRTLKTIKKNGLQATAAKHGIDLRKYIVRLDTLPGTIPLPPLPYGQIWREKPSVPKPPGVQEISDIPLIPVIPTMEEAKGDATN